MTIKAAIFTGLMLSCLAMDGQCDQIIEPGGQNCTAVVVPSVVLTVTDPGGATVAAATITFALNGESYSGACLGDCDEVVLVYEETGEFDIDVEAPGYIATSRSLTVRSDRAGCHPVTEDLIVVLQPDQTPAALAGAWSTTNFYGTSDLRFGENGEIIGAILYNRTVAGDGNFYIAYNGNTIRGAAGQSLLTDNATEPTRNGDVFHFRATSLGNPIGFEDATIAADYQVLTGTLQGVAATYARLVEIPEPLRDPQ